MNFKALSPVLAFAIAAIAGCVVNQHPADSTPAASTAPASRHDHAGCHGDHHPGGH